MFVHFLVLRILKAFLLSVGIAIGILTVVVLQFPSHIRINTSSVQDIELGGQQKYVGNTLTKARVFPQGDDIPKPPPWTTPTVPIIGRIRDLSSTISPPYLTANFSFSPGLGNLMFQYASALALSKKCNATLLLPDTLLLRRGFLLSSAIFIKSELLDKLVRLGRWHRVYAKDCCRYYPSVVDWMAENITRIDHHRSEETSESLDINIDNATETNHYKLKKKWYKRPRVKLKKPPSMPLNEEKVPVDRAILFGYFQSWKYFEDIRDELFENFNFLPDIRRRAEKLIASALKTAGANVSNVTLIGVHVRHGIDMTWNTRNLEHGHIVAPALYYSNAMTEYQRRYPNAFFLIFSDSVYWARQNIAVASNVAHANSAIREVDLCALTLTSHIIMSQGTYSWWAAYLTKGDVIYYKGWPRYKSKMDLMLNRTEYFYPRWEGMEGV